MPELVIVHVSGEVERFPLTGLEPWTAEDVQAVLASVCSAIQPPPATVDVLVRWLPDDHVGFEGWGALGAMWLDAIPVETGAVLQALEELSAGVAPVQIPEGQS